MRWEVDPLVIVGWAIEQRLTLTTALPMVTTSEGKTDAGLREIAGEDVFSLFGPDAMPRVYVRRFRKDAKAPWEIISDPAEGVPVRAAAVLMRRPDVERFERTHRLFGSVIDAGAAKERPNRGGRPQGYDWDAFSGALARRVFDHGMPESQGELVQDMLEWFIASHGAAPDESTVRRRVQAAWRELIRPA